MKNIGVLGLVNNGNTCYLNSCLQLISQCGNFSHKMFIETKNKNYKEFNELEINILKFLYEKWVTDNKLFNPINIQKSLIKKNSIFEFGSQNDSSESMIFILDLIEHKIFKSIFENKIKSIRQCMNCKKKFKSIETFNLLTLDMKPTINESINDILQTEKMDGQVECEKCKTKQDFERTYKIDELSDNLILHLKRFKHHNNRYIRKNDKIKIEDIININNHNYELRGFIVHTGSMEGGHYFFMGKNLSNNWFMYNDRTCLKIPMKLINFESSCYILLYEKIN